MPQRGVRPSASCGRSVGFWIVMGCVALALFVVFMTKASRAHGDAAWIGDLQIKNRIGELCCGERDCARVADDDVITTARGYVIRSTGETVPYSEALPTPPDIGGYWRCDWGGVRKCFFAPPQGS